MSASRWKGTGALRGRNILGRGAPSEMVHVGLVRRVARPEETEDRRRSRKFWRVGGWRAAGLGQVWRRVRPATVWPGRRSSCGKRVGRRWRRTFGAWRKCGKQIDGLGDAFGGRGRYVDAVAAILLGVCANVPAVDDVTGPGVADSRGFMDKDSSEGWCKGDGEIGVYQPLTT